MQGGGRHAGRLAVSDCRVRIKRGLKASQDKRLSLGWGREVACRGRGETIHAKRIGPVGVEEFGRADLFGRQEMIETRERDFELRGFWRRRQK